MGQKKVKAERRRQRELAAKRAVEEVNNKRSYWPLYVGGSVLAIVGTVGTIIGSSGSELEKKVSKQVVSASIEKATKISFQQAKADESLRQAYCNYVFQNRAKFGDIAWDSFLSIEYDPGYKRLKAEKERLGFNPEGKTVYATNEEWVHLATILNLYEIGKKNPVWISDKAFEWFTEDEFLSLLDNEASHAIAWEKQKMHLPIRPDYMFPNKEDFMRVLELASFDIQFSKIEKGKRRVRQKYIDSFTEGAKEIFSYFIELGKKDTLDGQYARELVEVIRARPTIKYFE